MYAVLVGFTVDCHCLNTKLPRCPYDSARYFPSVQFMSRIPARSKRTYLLAMSILSKWGLTAPDSMAVVSDKSFEFFDELE